MELSSQSVPPRPLALGCEAEPSYFAWIPPRPLALGACRIYTRAAPRGRIVGIQFGSECRMYLFSGGESPESDMAGGYAPRTAGGADRW